MLSESNQMIVPETEEPRDIASVVAVPTAALDVMQRAEIDIQIATAKKYRRPELAMIRKRMLSFSTLDEETAEGCFYTLKRFDRQAKEEKIIQGPSVRLAEIAIACYQNLRVGSRIIKNDGKMITSQGVAFDLENNVLISVEVDRRITSKDGRPYSEDMQIMTANACNSIAMRNAVFKVIPMALVKPVYEETRRVAVGDASTLAQKREKLFKRFYSMGVDRERILALLEKQSVESVDLEDLTTLIGIGTAIKDGELTIEEAFYQAPREDAAPVKMKLRDKLLARRAEETKPAVTTVPEKKPPESEGKA